jgi:hypothetical protein
MPLNIDSFRNNLAFHGGPAPVNRYEVVIPRFQTSSLTLLCEQAELPGKTILTVEDKLYGPVRKIGYGQMFIDTTMTFICTADGWEEKEFFDDWQNQIVDPDMYDANYYENYITNIHLKTFTEGNQPSYGIIFMEAFPLNVGAINLGWSQNNEYARLSVTFAYRRWKQQIKEIVSRGF